MPEHREETVGHAPELPYQVTYQLPNGSPFVVVETATLDDAAATIKERAMWQAAAIGGTWHRVGAGLGPSEFIVLSPAGQAVVGTFAIRRIIPAFRRQLPITTESTR